MTGSYRDRCIRIAIPYQIGALALLWTLAAMLMVVGTVRDDPYTGGWAVMLCGVAASWTAIVGVKAVILKFALNAEERLLEKVEGIVTDAAPDVADEVMRRIELAKLEEQVTQMVPQRQR